MTTLITASENNGKLRRCDATCYNATGQRCTCICGGLNHGKGLNTAATFTDHLYELITKQIKIRFPTVKLVTFHQAQLELRFHAPQLKANPDEHPTQTESADRNASDR